MSLIVDKVNDLLKNNVVVEITVKNTPVPHVIATAWLDGSFQLATEISKSDVTTGDFDEKLGIEIATNKVLNSAKNKLFELEAYLAFTATQFLNSEPSKALLKKIQDDLDKK